MLLAASSGALEGTINSFLEQPTFWGFLILGGVFFYFWRKDVSNPQRTASAAVLSGAIEHSAAVYATATEALEASRRCERRNQALFDYTRTLQGELLKLGQPVPPMPEDALD